MRLLTLLPSPLLLFLCAAAVKQRGLHVRRLLCVGAGHAGCAHDHGVPVRFLARLAPPLGGVPEQVLQVRATVVCHVVG